MRPYLWMLAGALAFAVMSYLVRIAGNWFSWQTIAVARTGLALVFAASLVWGARAQFVFLRPATLWWRSLAGSASLLANFYAMTHLPISDVLTISNMFPLWVAVLSWPLLGAVPPLGVWGAVAIGVAGVALIQQPHFQGDSPTSRMAIAMAVLSSFTSAIALLGLHRLKGIDARAIVAHFSAVAMFFAILAVGLFPSDLDRTASLPVDLLAWIVLIGVGASATAGQIFLTKAFAAGPPARVSVVGLAQVIFAMLLERAFENRSFSYLTLTGMALTLLPTAWTLLHRYETTAEEEAAVVD
jgi:drug/metabolite transporter (DMT)-like permease